jgi:hypothetical protein
MSNFHIRFKLLIILSIILIGGIGFFALFLNKTIIPSQNELKNDNPQDSKSSGQPIDNGKESSLSGQLIMQDALLSGDNPKYEISFPSGWIQYQDIDTENSTYQLLLSKDNHEITISQLEAGQAICQYPQHPAVEKTSIQFDQYQEFTNKDGSIYRRSRLSTKEPQEGFINWTICQFQKGEEEFVSPTFFGYIIYRTPSDYNGNLLSEMDMIIASIKPLSPLEL